MVDTLFLVPLQAWWYTQVKTICETAWEGARSLLVGGFYLQAVNNWLQTTLFGPAISHVAFISDGFLPLFATLAVWLLAFSYLLSPLLHIRVVDWKKALLWFIFATFFFQYGPGLYIEVEQMRREFASTFYEVAFGQVEEAGGIAPLAAIHNGSNDVPLRALSNEFGGFIEGDEFVDGLDIAMAYLLAGHGDVLAPPETLPLDFVDNYFPEVANTIYWLSYTPEQRNQYISLASLGIFRIILGVVIIIFGLAEQLIYLCLTISVGILFICLMIALPLSVFERTELMARSVLDMMLELFIFSAVVATFQAIVIGVVTTAAETLNPTLGLGASALGLCLEIVLLMRAVGTISDAFTRMFQAMSQVVGGRVMSPVEAAMAGVGAAGAAAVGIATAGVGAAGTLMATGSLASAAGSALAGSDKLFNTAALGQMALPEGSALKEKLSSYYEGALAQRMAPGMGGLLLRHDSFPPKEAAAQPSAEGMREAARQQAAAGALPAAGGEQDIRFDSADLVQLRDALATAVASAIRATPAGGYADPSQALSAINAALSALGRDPRKDPAMGAHLARQENAMVSYVMTGNLTLTEQSKHGSTAAAAQSAERSQTAGGHSAPTPPPTQRK